MAVETGGPGADFFTGGQGNDTLSGLGGDDRLNGNPGADILNGGDGDDLLYDGILTFRVSDGSYTHSSDAFGDTLNGGAGNDQIFGSVGDSVIGGAGFDRMTLSLGFGAGLTIDMRIVQAGGTIFVPGIQNSGGGYIVIPNGAQISGIEQVDGLDLTMGADTFYGTSNPDFVDGREGDDALYGFGGDDILRGGQGSNLLDGGAGNDILEDAFGGGVQTMLGGTGDDQAMITNSASSFDGGAGFDSLIVQSSGAIDLSPLDIGGAGTLGGGGTVRNVEEIRITAFGTVVDFTGSLLGESVFAVSGVLNAHGRGGDDVLSGSFGESLADTLFGDDGDDRLSGSGGDDILDGGSGDDMLAGGVGTNILSGGTGIDLAAYSGSSSAVWVDLQAGVYAAPGVWDVFQDSIEGLVGTFGDDTLFGDANGNTLLGADGGDTLIGRDGGDILAGDAGDDWLDGGGGDDILEGGSGVNVLIGGDGLDLASYASATSGLWIDMPAGVYSAEGVWDVFFQSIEGVLGGAWNDSIFGNGLDNTLRGGAGDDALIGGAGADRLEGGAGSDWIVAGEGNDRLIGGDGVDVLTGGAGADTFDLGAAAGWDVAFDFNAAEDHFSLGGLSWLGLLTIDADGDGQTDDTLLGYAGGNFVAIGVSGLSLTQWNALVDAPASAPAGAKMIADADVDPLSAWADPGSPGQPKSTEVDTGLHWQSAFWLEPAPVQQSDIGLIFG